MARFPDQTLVGDLNDNTSATFSGSVSTTQPLTGFNENETVYDLLPVVVNRPPEIILPIADAATPPIQPYATANASGDFMYLHPDGTVKVGVGTEFKLAVKAQQPPILNVENGLPTLLQPNTNLTYTWRKDGDIIVPSLNNSLRSAIEVNNDTLTFKNIQLIDNGTYVCDISNDIGVTSTEPITIEVLEPDSNSLFFRNLITNPYGSEGTNGWNSNNSDLIARSFVRTPSQDLIKPNAIDKFGYTVDMMHPRPYQLDTGVLRGFDMTNYFIKNGTYFTRSRFKFERKGGTFLVKAYQDIDLSDLAEFIRGGVYGMSGVRALFSCYIGNAVNQFVPVEQTLQIGDKTNPQKYNTTQPRISVENFLLAGPAVSITDKVYVNIEEYNNQTRLPSLLLNNNGSSTLETNKISLLDPWTKRVNKYKGRRYYNDDYLNVGELSKADSRDALLFSADELYPDPRFRYTYGQYIEFNKLVIDKLNPKTTKIRITINFETTDPRIFDQWPEALSESDEILDISSWEQPFVQNRWSQEPGDYETSIVSKLKKVNGNAAKRLIDYIPVAQDPRGMITGLNLMLMPMYKQQPAVTNYYTNSTLVLNSTPPSSISTPL